MDRENQEKIKELLQELNQVILGKEKQVELVCVALIAGGHILLEDIPGVGKTTLAKAVAKMTGLSFGRIQFTPDTLPGDVMGYSIYNPKKEEFIYQEGPVMKQVLLGDEINRTSPKTQAALLEAMEEGQVTVDGTTYALPSPFFVIATQNPVDFLGTYRLPEAQLDRFFCRISLGYPGRESETRMIEKYVGRLSWADVPVVLQGGELLTMQKEASMVKIHPELIQYILDIVEATRNHEAIVVGISPRGTLAEVRAALSMAYIKGRDYVIPEDIVSTLVPVLAHRLSLSSEAKMKKMSAANILMEIKNDTKIPL